MKGQALAATWMGEAEPASMKHEPAGLRLLAVWFCVDRVAKDWTTKVQHMHPNLVGSPSMEVTMDQRAIGGGVGAEIAVIGDRWLARARIDDCHF